MLVIGLLIPTQVLSLSVTGDQKIVVITMDYNDTIHTGTKQQISDKVFGNVSDYYDEVSCNEISIAGNISDVYGYYQLPRSSNQYKCDSIKDAIDMSDANINFSEYDHVIVVVPGSELRAGRCHPFNIATDDGKTIKAGIIVNENDPYGAFAHELAHDLHFPIGLPDLYDTQHILNKVVYSWSLMSDGCHETPPTHISPWGKVRLGWLNAEDMTLGEERNITIAPEETCSGIRAVKVPKGNDLNHYYLVEVRQRLLEQGLPLDPDEYDSGVFICNINEPNETEIEDNKVNYNLKLNETGGECLC